MARQQKGLADLKKNETAAWNGGNLTYLNG
jgi:hypothetical protein